MLHSTDYRELRNGKRYSRSAERKMSHDGSTEELVNRSSSENVEGESPEIQTLTQEAVNEQIRGFIAPVTRQLEDSAGARNVYLKASEFIAQDWAWYHFWYAHASVRHSWMNH